MNPFKAFDRYATWALDQPFLVWMCLAMWTIIPAILLAVLGPVVLVIWFVVEVLG